MLNSFFFGLKFEVPPNTSHAALRGIPVFVPYPLRPQLLMHALSRASITIQYNTIPPEPELATHSAPKIRLFPFAQNVM